MPTMPLTPACGRPWPPDRRSSRPAGPSCPEGGLPRCGSELSPPQARPRLPSRHRHLSAPPSPACLLGRPPCRGPATRSVPAEATRVVLSAGGAPGGRSWEAPERRGAGVAGVAAVLIWKATTGEPGQPVLPQVPWDCFSLASSCRLPKGPGSVQVDTPFCMRWGCALPSPNAPVLYTIQSMKQGYKLNI